jgi:hypothetical protein
VNQSPETQDVFGSGLAPDHSRLLEAAPDDGFAPGFDHARAVLGAIGVTFHTVDLQLDDWGCCAFGPAPVGVEVEDLDGPWEGEAAVFSNPCGSVTDVDDLLDPFQTAAAGFLAE